MKYLTPDRLIQLNDLTNKPAFLAAMDAWEESLARYRTHLQGVKARLPKGLRRLIETVYLHDAPILGMFQGQRSRFTITMHPETDPLRLVTLDYSLSEAAWINKSALPDELHSSPVCWLYDEVDVEEASGQERTFRHDILLSNGWEVRLRFRKVAVHRLYPLLPAQSQDHVLATVTPSS